MRPQTYKRPNQDMGELPPEVQPYVDTINSQIDDLTNVLMGKVADDNSNTYTLSYKAKDKQDITLKHKCKGKAKFVEIRWTSIYSPWHHCWRVIDKETVQIQVTWDSTPTEEATIEAVVYGE